MPIAYHPMENYWRQKSSIWPVLEVHSILWSLSSICNSDCWLCLAVFHLVNHFYNNFVPSIETLFVVKVSEKGMSQSQVFATETSISVNRYAIPER